MHCGSLLRHQDFRVPLPLQRRAGLDHLPVGRAPKQPPGAGASVGVNTDTNTNANTHTHTNTDTNSNTNTNTNTNVRTSRMLQAA